MNAHTPPFFCASAIACNVSVVLPEDSGPNTSMMRPARVTADAERQSSPMEPEGMTSTSTFGESPSFMMASSPNLVLMSRMAASIALLSFSLPEPIVFSGFFSFPFSAI